MPCRRKKLPCNHSTSILHPTAFRFENPNAKSNVRVFSILATGTVRNVCSRPLGSRVKRPLDIKDHKDRLPLQKRCLEGPPETCRPGVWQHRNHSEMRGDTEGTTFPRVGTAGEATRSSLGHVARPQLASLRPSWSHDRPSPPATSCGAPFLRFCQGRARSRAATSAVSHARTAVLAVPYSTPRFSCEGCTLEPIRGSPLQRHYGGSAAPEWEHAGRLRRPRYCQEQCAGPAGGRHHQW